MNDETVIDIAQAKNQFNALLKRLGPQLGKLLLIPIVLWLASGIYTVAPDEVGIVKRFGRFVSETPPGPHWHIPYPIETVLRPKVTKIFREEIGFRTISPGPPARYRAMPREANMLTGDENIVSVEFIVQYKIKNPTDFLFNVKNPTFVIRKAAEASIREVVGQENIDELLTTGKQRIQDMTGVLLQRILDSYKIGINVITIQLQDVNPPREVITAFKDVASAREDKEKLINQALGYQNELIPQAKGRAAEIINQAEGYRQSRISRAQGDVERFNQTYNEYRKNRDIIGTRIYIEAMQEILSKPQIILMEDETGRGMLPLFSIDKFTRAREK